MERQDEEVLLDVPASNYTVGERLTLSAVMNHERKKEKI